MTATVTDDAKRALLDGLIDDAALFPPAHLAMRPALAAHRRHRESAYAWLGGRFILPASGAGAFVAARDVADGPIAISAILDASRGGKGDVVAGDLGRLEGVRALPGVTIDRYEMHLGSVHDTTLRRGFLALGAAAGTTGITLFVEAPHATLPDIDATLAALVAARADAPAGVTIGAKLRCGGPPGAPVAGVAEVAAFLAGAHAHGIPWKATGGLRRPIRGADGQHGFLNLVVAAVAVSAGAAHPAQVGEILHETDPRAFVVDPLHVAWRDVRVDTAAVAAARAQCVAIGSASFDEPVNALRALGMIA